MTVENVLGISLFSGYFIIKILWLKFGNYGLAVGSAISIALTAYFVRKENKRNTTDVTDIFAISLLFFYFTVFSLMVTVFMKISPIAPIVNILSVIIGLTIGENV